MRDTLLKQHSPLDSLAKAGRHGRADGEAGVLVAIKPDMAIAAIVARRGRGADVAALLSQRFGVAVTDQALRVASQSVAISGIGPGQWLAASNSDSHADLTGQLRTLLDGVAAVTDQSDSRIAIEIGGPRTRDALAKGIAIDLDAGTFPAGAVAQTITAHIAVQIACLDADRPVFQVLVARSVAGSFWSWFAASTAEFGCEVRVSRAKSI